MNTDEEDGDEIKKRDPDLEDEAVQIAFDGCDCHMHVSGARLEFLRSSHYCAALLSGRWSSADEKIVKIKLPCEHFVCEQLFHLLEHGTLEVGVAPHVKLLAELDALVDMLGFPPRAKNPLLERGQFFADLYRISPEWWLCHQQEQTRMLCSCAADSDAALIPINAARARCTGYTPLIKDDLWLFKSLPHLLDADCEDCCVYMADPAITLLSQLPPVVVAILRRHATCAVVAGGAVLGGVSKFIGQGTDVDIFLYGLGKEASSAALADIEAFVEGGEYADVYDKSISPAAVTYTKKGALKPYSGSTDAWLLDRPFQIVLGLHRARSQVLEYFDLAPTKVLARIDPAARSTRGRLDTLIVEALPSFDLAMQHHAFFVDCMTGARRASRASPSTWPRGLSAPCPACAARRSSRRLPPKPTTSVRRRSTTGVRGGSRVPSLGRGPARTRSRTAPVRTALSRVSACSLSLSPKCSRRDSSSMTATRRKTTWRSSTGASSLERPL